MQPALVVVLCLLVRADVPQPQAAVNRYDTCFSQHKQVWCWGGNQYGQLGLGHTDTIGDEASDIGLILYPIDLGDDFVVKLISGGGWGHHCAVSVDGRLKCWGENNYGMSIGRRV